MEATVILHVAFALMLILTGTEVMCIFCDAPVEGKRGENLIDFVEDTNVGVCQILCEADERCKFFTFHYESSSLYPKTCFLLTEIQGPLSPCQDDVCVTVSSQCENNACGFCDDNICLANGMVANETKIIDFLAIGPCSVGFIQVVAVGGGGHGIYAGGSGSGYVEFASRSINSTYRQFEAKVGKVGTYDGAPVPGEASELTDMSDGSSVITAMPGGDPPPGNSVIGGDGYSGGGGYGNLSVSGGNGGSDGSDGNDSVKPGGQGSGFDIGTIPLKTFELR